MLERKYDVVVVGGGTGGAIAAISAGRQGCKTLLLERYGFLGGTATAGGLCNMSSFYFQDEQVIRGLPYEFMSRLAAGGGATPQLRSLCSLGMGYYCGYYNREMYKWLLLKLARDAGCEVLLHTRFVETVTSGDRAIGVRAVNSDGIQTFYADVIIDATSDAEVAVSAGAEFTLGDEDGLIQPGSLMFDMGNVDIERLYQYVLENLDDFDVKTEQIPIHHEIPPQLQQHHFNVQGFFHLFQKGLHSGEVYSKKSSLLLTTTSMPRVVCMNSTRIHCDPSDAVSRSEAEWDGISQAVSIASFLTERIPGFEHANLIHCGTEVGFRESRHIVGEYTITEEDVREGRKFYDVIARNGFPCDIHKETAGAFSIGENPQEQNSEGFFWLNKDAYDIPYRSLIPRKVDGILVIGKCISASHIAHGSTRLMPVIMAEGEAAGVAAKLAIESGKNLREIALPELQRRLIAQGASLYRDEAVAAQERRVAKEKIQAYLETHVCINSLAGNVEWYDT